MDPLALAVVVPDERTLNRVAAERCAQQQTVRAVPPDAVHRHRLRLRPQLWRSSLRPLFHH